MLHQNARCINIYIRPHLRGVWLPWLMSGKFTVYRQSNAQVCGLSVSVYLTHNLIVFRFQVAHNDGYNQPNPLPQSSVRGCPLHIYKWCGKCDRCVLRLKLISIWLLIRNWRPQHLGNLIYIIDCYDVESVYPWAAVCFQRQEWLYSLYGSEIFYIEFFKGCVVQICSL